MLVGGCSVVLGGANWFLIIKNSAMNRAAATTADVAAMTYHACHAGRKVSRYRSEPIRKNSAAAPAMEMPMDIMTALVMLMMRSFFRRFFRAASCFWMYSFRVAFASFRNWVMRSFRFDVFCVKSETARFWWVVSLVF